MAFSFFKRNQAADLIFSGGVVYTADFNQPKAEAVAVKDGKILWAGTLDEMEQFRGGSTEEIDLEGGFLLPGFFQMKGHPVLDAFLHSGLRLTVEMSREEILEALRAFVAQYPELPSYFGYGYRDNLFTSEDHIGARELLDSLCSDRPVLLLSHSGYRGWCNSCALEMAEAMAAEDQEALLALRAAEGDDEEEEEAPLHPGFLQDPYPGVQFFARDEEGRPTGVLVESAPIMTIIDAADPLCLDQLPQTVLASGMEFSRQGYTSVFDCGGPDYLDNYYIAALTTILQEELPPHRFFGSMTILGNPHPVRAVGRLLQKNTACMECSEFMGFRTLRVAVVSKEGALIPTTETLEALCVEAGDRGCDVQLFPTSPEALSAAIDAFAAVRRSGYKKNRLILSCEALDADADTLSLLRDLDVIEDVPPTDFSTEAVIDRLTIDAAYRLRQETVLGSIEKGKLADFVLLEKDPYEFDGDIHDIPVLMTIIAGEVIQP